MITYGEDLVRLDLGVADKLQRVYWPDMALDTHPPMMATVEPSVQQPGAQSCDKPATGSKRRAECMEDVEMEDVAEPSPSKRSKTLLHVLPRSLTPARTLAADSTPHSHVLPDATESSLTNQADEADSSTRAADDFLLLSNQHTDEISSLSAGISLLSLSIEKETETSE